MNHRRLDYWAFCLLLLGWTSALEAATLPEIVSLSSSQYVGVGDSVVFSVEVTESESLQYQWRFNGSDLRGEKSSSLALFDVQLTDSGSYRVVVSNEVGDVVSEEIVVTVVDVPSIINHPSSQITQTGVAVSFEVKAEGDGELSYQWLLNGLEIPFATGPALIVENPKGVGTADYRVVVNGVGGSVTSEIAQLVVRDEPPLFEVFETGDERWPVAAASELGMIMVFNYDQQVKRFNSASVRTSDNQTATLWYGVNGLPTRLATDDQVILFANYTATTVDLSIISLLSIGQSETTLIPEFPLGPDARKTIDRIRAAGVKVQNRPIDFVAPPRDETGPEGIVAIDFEESVLFEDEPVVKFVSDSVSAYEILKEIIPKDSPLNGTLKNLKKRRVSFSLGGLTGYAVGQAAEWGLKETIGEEQTKGIKDSIGIASSFLGCTGGGALDCFNLFFNSATKAITAGQLLYRILNDEIVTAKEALVKRSKPMDPNDPLNLRDSSDPFDPFQPGEPRIEDKSDCRETSPGSGWRVITTVTELLPEDIGRLSDELDDCRGVVASGFNPPLSTVRSLPFSDVSDYPVLDGLGVFGRDEDRVVRMNGLARMVETGILSPDSIVWADTGSGLSRYRALSFNEREDRYQFGTPIGQSSTVPGELWGQSANYERLRVDYTLSGPQDFVFNPGSFPARIEIQRESKQHGYGLTAPSTSVEYFETQGFGNGVGKSGYSALIPIEGDYVVTVEETVTKGNVGEKYSENFLVALDKPNLYWNTSLNAAGLLRDEVKHHSGFLSAIGEPVSVDIPYDGKIYLHDVKIVDGARLTSDISAGTYHLEATGDHAYYLNQEHPLAGDIEPNNTIEMAQVVKGNELHGVVGFGTDAEDLLEYQAADAGFVTLEYFIERRQGMAFSFLELNDRTPSVAGKAPAWRAIENIPVQAGEHHLTVNAGSPRFGELTPTGYQFRLRSADAMNENGWEFDEHEPNDGKLEAAAQGNSLQLGADPIRGMLGVRRPLPLGLDRTDVYVVEVPRDGRVLLVIETFDDLMLSEVKWGVSQNSEFKSFSRPEMRGKKKKLEFEFNAKRGETFLSLEKGFDFSSDTVGDPDGIVFGFYNVSVDYVDGGATGEGSFPIEWLKGSPAAFQDRNLNTVAYGDGTWVAAGASGTLLWSTDGNSWSEAASDVAELSGVSPNVYGIKEVVFGGGTWVANLGSFLGSPFLTSKDGKSWNLGSGGPRANIRDLAYQDGVWVAVGMAGSDNAVVFNSADGKVWSKVAASPELDLSQFHTVAFGDGLWIATGESQMDLSSVPYSTSDDGLVWSESRLVGTFVNMSRIEFGEELWAGIDDRGQIRFGEGPNREWLGNWARGNAGKVHDVAFADGIWLAVGPDGTIAESGDGRNWNFKKLEGTPNLNALASDGSGGWVIVGDSGTILLTPGLGGAVSDRRFDLALVVDPEEGGEVLLNPQVGQDQGYLAGDEVNLLAVPNPGFEFDRWDGDLSGDDNPFTLVMSEGRSVTALFSRISRPIILTQPESLTLVEGGVGKFSVAVDGKGDLRYQWSFNGNEISNANESSYLINKAEASNAGLYTVVVSNEAGTVISHFAFLTVNPRRTFGLVTISQGGRIVGSPDKEAYELDDVVRLEAIPDPGFQFDGWEGAFSANPNPVSLVMNQDWKVEARFIPLLTPPTIVASPQSLEVNVGESVTLTVIAQGSVPLDYQWKFNGVDLPLANQSSYTLPALELSHGGAYSVLVSNSADTVQSEPAVLTVLSPIPPTFPVLRPTIDSIETLPDGEVRLIVRGPETAQFGVEISNDLLTWNTFGTVTLSSGKGEFVDSGVSAESTRFYRLIKLLVPTVPSGPNTVVLSYDFNSELPDEVALFGDATRNRFGGVDNSGYLKITDAALFQNGALMISTPKDVEAFRATFSMRIGDNGFLPGSGFSLNVASDLPTGVYAQAEEGYRISGKGLIFSFDNWNSGEADDSPSIEMKWEGQSIANKLTPHGRDPRVSEGVPSIHRGDHWFEIQIDLDADGKLDLRYDNRIIFQGLATGFTGIENALFGIGARTEGATQTHWIDNLEIELNGSSE